MCYVGYPKFFRNDIQQLSAWQTSSPGQNTTMYAYKMIKNFNYTYVWHAKAFASH